MEGSQPFIYRYAPRGTRTGSSTLKSEPMYLSPWPSKQYPAKIAEYTGDILLVGINYDKEAKKHTCKIERIRNGVYNC